MPAMAYGTDGELAALGLTALCDDKGAQIVYAPAPVVRDAVLQQYPQIAAALDPVFASLTLETLQAAERPHRGRWRGGRRGGPRLAPLAALSAVIRNRVLPLLFAASAAAVAAIGVCRGGAEPAAVGRTDRAVRGLRLAAQPRDRGARHRSARDRAGTAEPRPASRRRAACRGAAAAACWRRPGRRRRSLAATAPALARVSLGAAFWVLLGAAALAIVDALQRAGAGTGERLAVAADRHRRVRGDGARPGCSTRCRWPASTGPARRRSPPR